MINSINKEELKSQEIETPVVILGTALGAGMLILIICAALHIAV